MKELRYRTSDLYGTGSLKEQNSSLPAKGTSWYVCMKFPKNSHLGSFREHCKSGLGANYKRDRSAKKTKSIFSKTSGVKLRDLKENNGTLLLESEFRWRILRILSLLSQSFLATEVAPTHFLEEECLPCLDFRSGS